MSTSTALRGNEVNSPDIFVSDVRCNLDRKFLDARDSIKTENMSVFARVRPLLAHEEHRGFKECIAVIDEETVRAVVPVTSSKYKNSRQSEEMIEDYKFTGAYGPETGQFAFFQETMQSIMENFVGGFNSLVFSYGITGSGKTFTMQGDSENPGIIPLALKLYFGATQKQLMKEILVKPSMHSEIITLSENEIEREKVLRRRVFALYDNECDRAPGSFRNNNSKSFAMSLCNMFYDNIDEEERQTTLSAQDIASVQAATLLKNTIQKYADEQHDVCNVWVSFIEIYNESIFDLLHPVTNDRPKLTLGEDKNGNVYVKGAREVCIFDSDEGLKLLNIGRKHLSIASTKMNYQSSRSHCIYTIRVVKVPDVHNISPGTVNRLSFCDLAGSERASKTQTVGVRLKEAGSINTSLLVLGRCLQQLRLKQMGRERIMIPFRESKLTRIFSGFFLGQGKAVMIANASPSDYTFDETLHVLKFSAVARKILVNNTFLSAASSTLQSICSQWEKMNTTNCSFYNESMESVESDSDIISMKDELIEKLMNLARTFAEKEKEWSEAEYRIRQEVCQEYSESTDELLRITKENYEEQIAALKEIYEKRYKKLCDIYDNHKEELKDCLEEESLSFERTVDLSKSFENEHDMSAASESEVFSDQTPNSVGKWKSDFENVSAELTKLKEILHAKESKISNLERELGVLQSEAKNLVDERKIYQEQLSQSAVDTEKYKIDIAELESRLSSVQKELLSYKESAENKEFIIHEMQSEIQSQNEQIDILNKEAEICKENSATLENKLKETMETNLKYELDIKNYQKTIRDISEKLDFCQMESNGKEKKLKIQDEHVASLKKIIETYKEKNEKDDRKRIELSKLMSQYEDELNNYKITIKELNAKLDSHEENEEKMFAVRDRIAQLEKEMEDYKLEVANLQEKNLILLSAKKEMEQKLLSLESTLEEVTKKCQELENKNHNYKIKVEELQRKNSKIFVDHSAIDALETELASNKEELESYVEKYEATVLALKKANNKTEVYEEEFKILKEKNEELDQQVETLKKNIEKKETEVENCEIKIKDLDQDIETLKKNIVKKESENKVYAMEIIDLKEKYTEVCEELENMEKENAKQCTEFSKLEKKNKKLEEDIQDLKEGTNDLISKKKKLEEELSLAESNNEKIKKEMEELATQAEQNNKMNFEVEIRTLKQEKKDLMTEKENFEGKLLEYEKECRKLRDDLEKKSSNLHELEINKLKFEEEIEILKKDQHKLLEEKTKLEKQIISHQEEFEVVCGDLLKKSSELQELENRNTVDKQEIVNLKEKYILVCDELERLKTDLAHNSTVISELEKNKSKFELEIKTLKKEKDELMVEKQKLKEQILENEKELDTLRSDLQKKSSELHELENNKSTCKQEDQEKFIVEIKELKSKLSKVEQELNNLYEDNQQKSSEIVKLEKHKGKFESEIKILKKEKDDSMNEKQKLQGQILEKEKELDTVRSDLQKKSSELQELENRNTVDKQEIVNLKEKYVLVCDELERLKTDFANNSTIVSELEKNKGKFESEIKILKKEKDDLMNEKQKLQGQILENEKELGTLRRDLQKKSSELQELENNKSTCKQEDQEKFIVEIKELKSKLSKVEQELNNLYEDNQQKSSEIVKLEKCKINFEDEIKNLHKEKNSLLKEKAKIEEKLTVTEKELESLEEKSLMVSELKKRISNNDRDIKQITENLRVTVKEKENLEILISQYKEKIEALEEELSGVTTLRTVNDENDIKKLKEELEDAQRRLKEIQTANDNKLIAKEEQHMIEINETIKLKRQAEAEIVKLKEENLKLRSHRSSPEIEILETETSSKKNMTSSPKKREFQETEESISPRNSKKKMASPIKGKDLKRTESYSMNSLKKVIASPKKEESSKNVQKKSTALPKKEENSKNIQKRVTALPKKEESSKNIQKKATALPKKTRLPVQGIEKKTLTNRSASRKCKEVIDISCEEESESLPSRRCKEVIDISFEDSDVPDTPVPRKTRKRVSDEDFNPNAQASKKMKSDNKSNIPTNTTSRRKVVQNEPTESLSPLQRMANTVSSKFRDMAESVSTKISGQRVTRSLARRKLYDPDLASSSKSGTVSKGKK